jgi:hypothetical protein
MDIRLHHTSGMPAIQLSVHLVEFAVELSVEIREIKPIIK